MATYLTSNIFSDIYIGGNCVVKGTMTVSGGGGTTQWTTSGTNIYYNTGNVGIGTNAPEVKLDITDSSLVIAPTTFTGAANYGVFFRHGFATSNFYNCSILAFDHNGDNNPDGISINGYDGVSICTGANTRQERVRVLGTTGYVGILTNAPGYPLHVVGDINFTGSLRQSGTVYTPSSQWTGTATNPIYYVPFVGIGSTLTPTANLMVTGNVYVSNAIQTTNIVAAGFTSNATTTTFLCDTMSVPFVNATQVTAASSVGIGTTLPIQALDVYGSMNVATVISSTGLMFRNRIINGDMRINQRGATSLSITQSAATSQYLLDRWNTITNQTTGYFTSSVQTLTTSDTPYQYGFRNSMRVTATTGAALPNYIYPFSQPIEANNLTDLNWGSSYGASVTVSFWFRSNMAAGSTGSVSVRNGLAGGTWVLYNTTFTVVGGGAWQYVVVTIPPPANGTTWGTGTGVGMEFLPLAYNSPVSASGWVTSAQTGSTSQTTWWTTTGNYIEITGAQLEKGLVATPFEVRPYPIELQLCQRYFQKINNLTGGQNYYVGLAGGVNGYTCSIVTFKLTTAMRVTPTSYWYSDSGPQMITVAGATYTLNYIGYSGGSAVALPGLQVSGAAYGVDSTTDTTMITLLPCASSLTGLGANVPLFMRNLHIDFSSEF